MLSWRANLHCIVLLLNYDSQGTKHTNKRGSYPKMDMCAVSLPQANPGSTGSISPFKPAAEGWCNRCAEVVVCSKAQVCLLLFPS